jgi:hypothetical protein
MGVQPDAARRLEIDAVATMQTRGEYWDSDRATFEDELNAWRERTAAPVVADLSAATTTRLASRHATTRRPIAIARHPIAVGRRPVARRRPAATRRAGSVVRAR